MIFFRAGKPESGFVAVGLKAKPTFISLNPLAHFSFLQFFRGHSGRCFFYVGRCKKKFFRGGGLEYSRRVIFTFRFFHFFYFYTFSLFLHFLHFQIFSLFYIFTIFRFFHFLHFYIFTIFPRSL